MSKETGSGPNLAYIKDSARMAMLIAKGRIGLYQHPNDTSTLGAAGPEAMWPPGQHRGVNPDGSGQLVGEVGDVIPVDPEYRAYFGGSYPPEVSMKALTGSGSGTGSSTAEGSDAKPGRRGDNGRRAQRGHLLEPQ